MKPPPPYQEVKVGPARAWVLPEAREWTTDILGEGGTIYAEARATKGATQLHGRGPAMLIPAPSTARWVVRHYLRGGRVAPILADRYLRAGSFRPIRELASSAHVRELGIRTPRVVAAAVYLRGLYYRGDLVSEYVTDSQDLAEHLFGTVRGGRPASRPPRREQALFAAGRLIRELGTNGVSHADLNARNILLSWPDEDRHPLVHVLDLDRCRVRGGPLRDSGASMLARLVRSLRKIGSMSDCPLDESDWCVLRAGFEERP